ncbi:hypothetical protein H0A73_13645 [Alcaligenaceae bacterium]|nr:hypothetical protein [Alcaligenaceae bacterium]
MTHRHTILFGTVLAVAGAAIAADHHAHRRPAAAAVADTAVEAGAKPDAVPAPAVAAPPAEAPAVIEFAPCSANMDGLMAAPEPQPTPPPADTAAPIEFAPCSASMDGLMAAPAPQPAAQPTPQPAQNGEQEIIEFAPCAAAF